MIKCLVVSVATVFAALSMGGAQEACRQASNSEMVAVIGSTVGALVGSNVGDAQGRTVPTAAGGMLGGVLANYLSQRRTRSTPTGSLVKELRDKRTQIIDTAVVGEILIPRNAAPVRPQE